MLAEPAGLEILGRDAEAGGDVLGHPVEPFALFGREGLVGIAFFKPCS